MNILLAFLIILALITFSSMMIIRMVQLEDNLKNIENKIERITQRWT